MFGIMEIIDGCVSILGPYDTIEEAREAMTINATNNAGEGASYYVIRIEASAV